jgi:hypothetical protein
MVLKFTKSGLYLLLSPVLSYLTLYGISTLKYLPYTPFRGALLDALGFPGGAISSLFYPEGVHTGRGTIAPAYLAYAVNIVVYALLWFFAIQLIRSIRAKKSGT